MDNSRLLTGDEVDRGVKDDCQTSTLGDRVAGTVTASTEMVKPEGGNRWKQDPDEFWTC